MTFKFNLSIQMVIIFWNILVLLYDTYKDALLYETRIFGSAMASFGLIILLLVYGAVSQGVKPGNACIY